MIYSSKNKLFEAIFAVYLRRLLRKHFYKIHIDGTEIFEKRNKAYPTVIYCNHSNWWDGFIDFYLARNVLSVDSYLMMDIEQMRKYRFFRWLGVFSVDRNSPRGALESVEYASKLLSNSTRLLWIYPQGVMLPNDTRPLSFYSGITHLTEKLEKVNLLPMAVRYEFMMEQRPEIFIQVGAPDIVEQPIVDKNAFTKLLQEKLTAELDSLKERIVNNNLNDFRTVFFGRNSRNKTVDKIYSPAN